MLPSSGKMKVYLALFVALLSVSTSAIFVKMTQAPSSIIATYRMLITFVLFLPPTLYYFKSEIKELTFKDKMYSVVAGIFLAFHFISWFESLNYTTVASSVVLVSIQPIFTMIGGYIFFKEVYSKKAVLSTILAIIGSLIISLGDFQLDIQAFYGDLLAILGAIMASVYWLFGQYVRRKTSVLPYTTIVYGSATITLIIYDILLKQPLTNYSKFDWLIFFLLAIIPTVFGHTVFNWSIKYVKATTVSIVILGEPIGAAFLAYILYNEGISLTQITGGIIIILGISLFNRSNKTN